MFKSNDINHMLTIYLCYYHKLMIQVIIKLNDLIHKFIFMVL